MTITKFIPPAIYCVAAACIAFPIFAPGYVLTLDLIFAPSIALLDSVKASYPLYALLHGLNTFIPSEVLEKLWLFAVLALAGIGMHRLFTHLAQRENPTTVAAYFAGLFYMINPFVYSRFMAGQVALLLGYALLPFFVRSFVKFLDEPRARGALFAAAWLVLVSIASIHMFGIAILAGFVFAGVWLYKNRRDQTWRRRCIVKGAVGLAAILIACSYWLLPALLNQGKTVEIISSFGASDRTAFATSPNGFGWLGNVLALQGFWADAKSLYLVPQDVFGWWWLPWIAVWLLVAFGIYKSWQKQKATTAAFAAFILIAALLAIGTAGTMAAPLNDWLISHVPFFAGYREPQKFVALIALAYAYFGAVAVAALADKIKLAVLPLFALPLLIAPLLPGFYGQLVPRQYPADWFEVNKYLQAADPQAKVLFLPWHLYMPFRFAGRNIANPAPAFFDNPLIISDDPEMRGAKSYASTPDQVAIQTNIVPALKHGGQPVAKQLAMLNIRYVMVAKELDYRVYAHIELEDGIKLVRETENLKLYEVTTSQPTP